MTKHNATMSKRFTNNNTTCTKYIFNIRTRRVIRIVSFYDYTVNQSMYSPGIANSDKGVSRRCVGNFDIQSANSFPVKSLKDDMSLR